MGLIALARGRGGTALNVGSDPVDMTGWTLTDEEIKHTYTFASFTLASEATVTVHTGHGVNSATDLYWGRDPVRDPVWNDDGDTATLWDTSGTRIADSNGPVLGVPVRTPSVGTPPYPTTIQTPPAKATTAPTITIPVTPGQSTRRRRRSSPGPSTGSSSTSRRPARNC